MDAALKLDKAGEQQSPKKHPPGLYLLFFTEAWERFSYYGMRGLLVLYLTTSLVSGGLGFDKSSCSSNLRYFHNVSILHTYYRWLVN